MPQTMTLSSAAAAPGGPILSADGLAALAAGRRLILSDVWGVVHNGIAAHPAACDALARFRAGGGIVVMVSNAPRPHPSVIAQLELLGVPPTAYDAVVTSGDVTVGLMRERKGQRVFHIGADKDEPLFEAEPAERVPLERADYIVCSGLANDEVETLDDYREVLAAGRARGLRMICANPDLLVERGHRLIVCAGTLADHYASLGGEVTHAGKPFLPIYRAAMALAEAIAGRAIAPAETLAIGDALRTDVAGAAALGVDCLFLAAGIHAGELLAADGGVDGGALARLVARSGAAPRHVAARLVW
jgi:HAD superfamily hydrolase (TIGR01459 family)